MARQKQSLRARETGLQSIHFSRFDGIHNNCARTDLKPTELYRATNVDLDRNGLASLRPGETLIASGAYHSLSPDASLCVKDGVLCVINQDDSLTPLVTVGDGEMSYAFGGDANIYFTNNQVIGFVHNGEAFKFLPPDREYKMVPPPGQLVGYFNMSLYIAVGNILYFTDASLHNSIDMRNGFIQTPGRLIMFAPTDDGVFISDEESIYWLAGMDPTKWQWKRCADYPVIPGSVVEVDNRLFGHRKEDETLTGRTIVFNTPQGVCSARSGGVFQNVSARRYIGPSGTRGASYFKRGVINQFVTTVF